MQRTKTSNSTTPFSSRPISISTTTRFDKIEKLTTIVHEINQHQKQQKEHEHQNHVPKVAKTEISEKVIDLLKNKIKNNYDQMYKNYDDNRPKILKHINTIETNAIGGENAVNYKLGEIVKEKGKYDKLKAVVDEKQKKLKKLMDMRDSVAIQVDCKIDQDQIAKQFHQKIENFDSKKQDLEHQGLIYSQMLKERKHILLNLKEKSSKMQQQMNIKSERATKIRSSNYNKRNMLNKIQQNLQKEEQIEIPTKLAQELTSKMQEYENRQALKEIAEHQVIVEQEKTKMLKEEQRKEKENQKLLKKQKEHAEKNRLEELYNLYLIKNYEELKIKKLCGVESLEQIANGNLLNDKQNLDTISDQIKTQIESTEIANKGIEEQIKNLLKIDQNLTEETTVYQLQKLIQSKEHQKSLLKEQLSKKSKKTNEWELLMQMINKDGKKHSSQIVQQMVQKYRELQLKGEIMTVKSPKENPKRQSICESENSCQAEY